MAQQGTVKWFNNAKGYGFIQPETGGEDVFVHHTAIVSDGFRTLNQGEKVSFEIVEGPKGLQARNVLRGGSIFAPGGALASPPLRSPGPQASAGRTVAFSITTAS